MMNDKLKKIIERCKCSFELSINPHRDFYEDVEDYFDGNFPDLDDLIEDTGKDVYQK